MPDTFTKANLSTHCHLYIGEVSRRTGASRKAIRLYEARGLIPAPERHNAYRVYSERHLFLVHIIKKAQTVGFLLAELSELVGQAAAGHQFPIDLANRMVAEKATQLRNEQAKISATLARLNSLKAEMNAVFGPNP